MTILVRFWYRKEGQEYLKAVVAPLISQLGSPVNSLEVHPSKAEKGVNVKKNAKVILLALEDLIQRVYNMEKDGKFPK
jgi:hypothetical protein